MWVVNVYDILGWVVEVRVRGRVLQGNLQTLWKMLQKGLEP